MGNIIVAIDLDSQKSNNMILKIIEKRFPILFISTLIKKDILLVIV